MALKERRVTDFFGQYSLGFGSGSPETHFDNDNDSDNANDNDNDKIMIMIKDLYSAEIIMNILNRFTL